MIRFHVANLLRRAVCLIKGHQWEWSRFIALGSQGPSLVCRRCRKVIDHD